MRGGNDDARARRRLAAAFAVSLALHLLLALALGSPTPDAPPPVPPPLIARLAPPPEQPPSPVQPAPPPPVIKDTLKPPKAEVLEDYIKPQPRRQITDEPLPQPKEPKPLPPKPPVARKPAEEPPPAEKPPAPPPVAAVEPTPRRSLDLSIPQERGRASPERLSPQELNETLTRLSEAILYPSEALRRGLEGEVVIVVELGEGGRILGAEIASGSGHPVLDDAAIRAVRRLGSLGPTTAHRTILLPVRFRIL